jgi:hypothetical protein
VASSFNWRLLRARTRNPDRHEPVQFVTAACGSLLRSTPLLPPDRLLRHPPIASAFFGPGARALNGCKTKRELSGRLRPCGGVFRQA